MLKLNAYTKYYSTWSSKTSTDQLLLFHHLHVLPISESPALWNTASIQANWLLVHDGKLLKKLDYAARQQGSVGHFRQYIFYIFNKYVEETRDVFVWFHHPFVFSIAVLFKALLMTLSDNFDKPSSVWGSKSGCVLMADSAVKRCMRCCVQWTQGVKTNVPQIALHSVLHERSLLTLFISFPSGSEQCTCYHVTTWTCETVSIPVDAP